MVFRLSRVVAQVLAVTMLGVGALNVLWVSFLKSGFGYSDPAELGWRFAVIARRCQVEGFPAEAALRAKNAGRAVYFELMGEAVPDRPWLLLMLAKVRVRAGDNKGALKALETAVKHGLKNPASVSQDPELQPLASDPAFRRIVEGMGAPR
jgi:hypothetical protein